MNNLKDFIKEKRDITDSTAKLYINNLKKLNGNKSFTSLKFLKDIDEIKKIMDKYAVSTQKNMIGTILSILKHKPSMKKEYKIYTDMLNNDSFEDNNDNKKNDKQKENWLDWNTIKEKQDELALKVFEFKNKKKITEKQYELLLDYLILSLYTLQAPRRNKDYLDMMVIKKINDDLDDNKNYLSIKDKVFIFNDYKTKKTYGEQKIKIKEDLMRVIKIYLRHHPLKKEAEYNFLVNYKGNSFKNSSSITKKLNSIFSPNKISSSMLRHIYLTNEFGDDLEKMKKISKQMAHSLEEQKDYIKTDE